MPHPARPTLRGAIPALAAVVAIVAGTSPAGAQGYDVVHMGDPRWQLETGGAGTGAITTARPRSGNGSLELRVEGNDTDWVYYRRVAGPALVGSFGLLADLDRLGFDWLRSSDGYVPLDVPWRAQSPVLRLYVREDVPAAAPRFSELVWERYYTTGAETPLDAWQREDLTAQNFWRVVFSGTDRGYTRAGCMEGPIDPRFPLFTLPPAAWAGQGGCYDAATTSVWGIGVGLGSNWPLPYRGFVDNVHLGFATDAAEVVTANFEAGPAAPGVVPEPGTIGMVAIGLAGAAAAARRRRARG